MRAIWSKKEYTEKFETLLGCPLLLISLIVVFFAGAHIEWNLCIRSMKFIHMITPNDAVTFNLNL